MKILTFSIFFTGCIGVEDCTSVDECIVGISQRLSALETKVENLEVENAELKNENAEIKHENAELRADVAELEKIVLPGKVAASCTEHADRGETENGVYLVKPNVEIEPFEVHCDFTTAEHAITVIKHDHENFGITSTPGQGDGCSDAGCYQDPITYDIEIYQIEAIIEISQVCEQKIVNNCTGNTLTNMAWWEDKSGNKIEYWDGNHPIGTEGCKCSLDGTGCNENQQGDSVSYLQSFDFIKFFDKNFVQYLCNCDAAGDMDIDSGVLSNKNQLPVTALSYGGSENRFSWIIYQLGYLQCHGKAENIEYPSERNANKIHAIESDIDGLLVRTGNNEKAIDELVVQAGDNEDEIESLKETVYFPDYYFKHQANKYVDLTLFYMDINQIF